MLRLAFDFIITWRETRTRPNAYTPHLCYYFHCTYILHFASRHVLHTINKKRREHEHIQIERISREQLFQHIQRFQHRKIRQMQTIVIIHNNQTAVTLQTAHSKKMHCFIIHTH